MWVRKTPEEIRKLELYRLKVFLIYFVFIFLVLLLGDKFIGENRRFATDLTSPLKWNEVIEKIPIYLIISLVLTIIGLKLDSDPKKKEKNKFICEKCNKYKNKEVDLCECGGSFIDIDKMKWIENEDKTDLSDIH